MLHKQMIILLVLSLILTTLVGCDSKDTLSIEVYSAKYYEVFSSIETNLDEGLIQETHDLIDIRNFLANYSHIDFVHYYDELIIQIDDALYQLSVLGPQLDDEILMKYQSKLEYELFKLMDTLKLYREHNTFSTNMTNLFTWFDELYNILADVTPILLNIQEHKLAIENQLASLGYEADEAYQHMNYNNLQSIAYAYAILSSQIASYQDYSGLQVNPRDPVAIETNDGHWHSTAELDYSVMIKTTKNLEHYQHQLTTLSNAYGIDVTSSNFILDFFTDYGDTYEKYALIRSEYSYDFFKKGTFKDYQIQQGTYNNNGRTGLPLHIFDPETDGENHLTEMTGYFNKIILLLIENDHNRFMIRHK